MSYEQNKSGNSQNFIENSHFVARLGMADSSASHNSSINPKPYKQQTSFAVWLFCFSSVYESKLSTQPQNKKASQLC